MSITQTPLTPLTLRTSISPINIEYTSPTSLTNIAASITDDSPQSLEALQPAPIIQASMPLPEFNVPQIQTLVSMIPSPIRFDSTNSTLDINDILSPVLRESNIGNSLTFDDLEDGPPELFAETMDSFTEFGTSALATASSITATNIPELNQLSEEPIQDEEFSQELEAPEVRVPNPKRARNHK